MEHMKTTPASVQLVSTASKLHRGLLNTCGPTLFGRRRVGPLRRRQGGRSGTTATSLKPTPRPKSPGFEELD